tara:strand:- start:1150 stop:1257 length:108 start_codon:yes stop_codon:yes gene_type:complete
VLLSSANIEKLKGFDEKIILYFVSLNFKCKNDKNL